MTNITKSIVNDIRTEIATVITTASNTSGVFNKVYSHPTATLGGFPAVVIMPSENEADYGSTTADRLTFGFVLHCYYPIKKEADYAKTETAVGECVGELLRIFSERSVLTKVDWVNPVPSTWGEIAIGEAVYRTADVTLKCVKYVDLN